MVYSYYVVSHYFHLQAGSPAIDMGAHEFVPQIMGDINRSGARTVEDAILVLRIIAGLPALTLDADREATGDGRIDPGDAIWILRNRK